MGRKKRIDREFVLTVAERIVHEHGAASLTIGAVATAAGITKGGVQSCFGTKEAMISAMLQRWTATYQEQTSKYLPAEPTAIDRVKAHVEVTMVSGAGQERAASLLAALLQSPEHLQPTRDWYSARMEEIMRAFPQGGAPLAAFIATEGAFLLRYLGLVDFSEPQWKAVRLVIDNMVFREVD